MRLTYEEFKQVVIDMEENETVMKEMYLSFGIDHEDAGDRV